MAATLMTFDFAVCRAWSRGIAAPAFRAFTGRPLPGVLLALLISAAPAAHAQTQPVAGDDGPFSVSEGGALGGSPSVLVNDSDPDGQPLTVTVQTPPSFASVFSLNPTTGVITYTHNGSETTSDAFTYQACDNEGPPQCDSASVTFTINPVNDPPVANPDSATVNEDTTNNPIDVTGNDTDAEGDTLDVTAVSANNGSVSVLGNNTVRYTPNPNYFGGDTINYTISDGNGGVASSTVTVTVNPVPDAPVAVNDTATVAEDSTNNVISVTDNDTDADGDSLTVTTASAASGSASPSGANVLYTPLPNFSGQDTISYTVSDGNGGTDNATVTVTVTSQNDPPVANDDTASVAEDSTNNVINVTANDTDPDGDPLTVSAASTVTGTVVRSGGNVVYTPPINFVGQVTVNYTVTDGQGGSDSAILTVSVSNTNDPPIAVDDTATVAEDSNNNVINVVANDTDPDGDPLAVTSASAANGDVAPNGGTVLYTPNPDFSGQDTINYTVSDGNGGADTAVVRVTVTNVNDPPVANDDTATVDEDTADNTINVTANDTDVDGDTLTVTDASALNGDVTFGGGAVRYTPDAGYSGPDTISYTISDGNGGTDSATVTVTVVEVNDPPVANDDTATVDEDSSIVIDVAANDTDEDGDDLTVSAASAANGTATPSGGDVRYTPNRNYFGPDTINYTISDGRGGTDTATVSVTVRPIPDAPVINGVVGSLTTPEDQSITITLANLNVSDADPDDVYPTGFSLQLQAGANYTVSGAVVTPAENFNGGITVPATVTDPGGLASRAFSVPVTVTAVNDTPVLDEPIGPQNALENAAFNLDISGNFSDADGDTLTYALTGLPASNNLVFDPVTGVISGTPRIEDARDNAPYVIVVTASDPDGTTTSDSFELTISALDRANLALTIDVSPDSGMPSDELRWTFTAQNPLGPQAGSNVELAGRFVGAGLTVTAEAGANCTIEPTVDVVTEFVCVIGALPVGASTSTVITTITSEATEVVAFATVAGVENLPIDPNEEDNSDVDAAGVAAAFSVGAVQILGSTSILSIAAGEVNAAGDGATDLVVGTAAGQPVHVYLSAAPRESCGCLRDFLPSPISIPDTGGNEGVALADFNGDGSLDLVVVNGGGQPDRVFANDGEGNFSEVATLENSFGAAVAVADFNLDGNADIAVAEIGDRNRVYLGDGTGGFPGGAIRLGVAVQDEANSNDVAAADLNGDGRPDLVFANVDGASEIWFAEAGGGFTSGGRLPVGDAAAVAAGDLNGDGSADLVFGRVPADVGDVPSNPVLLNDGNGGFGAPADLLGISPTNDVQIGDVNNDGSPDLVFINASGVHQVWTASGASFTLHREQIIDIDAREGVLANLGFTDTDTPGGLDLAMGGAASGGVAVYLNDAAGNLGRGDVGAPVITLSGSASVSIESGMPYSDSGASADDNIDGDISADIRVTNNVNTAVVGSYTVSYDVTDFAGNAATTVTRTVSVTPAAGSGGGGGGSMSYWAALVLLGLLAAGALRRPRIRAVGVHADIRRQRKLK